MIEEKFQKIVKLQDDIKYIVASINDLIPTNPQIDSLKGQRKELTKSIRELEDKQERQICEDKDLREYRLEKEQKKEELVNLIHDLFTESQKAPQDFSIDVETEKGKSKLQGIKQFCLFVNGKELKKKPVQQKLFNLPPTS